ncbi:hypothetical protein EV294_101188 [Paenibacillus sp. BK033]|uniref:hypothetical protein n=1 Tax=Paenibacillus sp. BK033 TaxID=2512133 RepID=UPI0010497634|nr:hypothetical protein [Paenibacillus sp. BK033]TCN00739.1 hypothetical protein EV294_101188 [Paenibacillus sp. BK033]
MSIFRERGFYIILCLAAFFLLAGCGGKEKSDEEIIQDKVEQAFKDAGIQTDTSTQSDEKPTVESTLMEIKNFVIGEIWNEGLVNIGHYAYDGTDATGSTMDIDFMIQQLSKSMEKKAEYDIYIQGLDSKYDEVKQLWTKVSGEIDTLYKKLQDDPPKAKDTEYQFDTGLYEQYSDAFFGAVEALNQK